MTVILRKYAMLSLLLWSSTAVFAQQGAEPSRMTYDLATTAVEAAEVYAREKGWNVTIMVTDQNNNPVMLRRLDGAGARTFAFATSKALVVNATGLTSGEYGAKVTAGELEAIEGGVTFAGGVPIFVGGVQIGAIATSGVQASQDEEVSLAGANAIGSATRN